MKFFDEQDCIDYGSSVIWIPQKFHLQVKNRIL